MAIKDLLGFSKPGVKLIEVISNGIGRITKSYYDKKDIDVEIYKQTNIQ